MASTLVDTNVLIDVFDPGSPWQSMVANASLRMPSGWGALVINPII